MSNKYQTTIRNLNFEITNKKTNFWTEYVNNLDLTN